MIQVELTIKKEGGDVTRKMTYNTQEEVLSDAEHLIEFLKNYAK